MGVKRHSRRVEMPIRSRMTSLQVTPAALSLMLHSMCVYTHTAHCTLCTHCTRVQCTAGGVCVHTAVSAAPSGTHVHSWLHTKFSTLDNYVGSQKHADDSKSWFLLANYSCVVHVTLNLVPLNNCFLSRVYTLEYTYLNLGRFRYLLVGTQYSSTVEYCSTTTMSTTAVVDLESVSHRIEQCVSHLY